MANLETAITCNHKRTPPKNWEKGIVKKKERLRKLRAKPPKTEKAQKRYDERLLKAKLSLQLAKKTKEYNLNTSLRNYIDPRMYKSWSDSVDLDWQKIYAKTLRKKFSWTTKSKIKWTSS
jgi:DNA topoisomerase-1